jgi:hypothetical protein
MSRAFVPRDRDRRSRSTPSVKPPIQKRKQRSFRCFRVWRATQDSNLRPLAPESDPQRQIQRDLCRLVNSDDATDSSENTANREAVGKTRCLNLPAEIRSKCADSALVAYLQSLAESIAISMAAAA